MERLAVIVLGNRNAGKSTTWNTLFGERVKTGTRMRDLLRSDRRSVKVFLISGSPEERKKYVGKLLSGRPPIVLCSLQYKDDARESVQYFIDKGYSLYVQWLNPGYNEPDALADRLGFVDYLLHLGATVTVRDGRISPRKRVREIRDYITGWAAGRTKDSE